MALSNIMPGFPSLSAETPNSLWHTGLETDPWRWKDRAGNEKRLAYGCILGGYKGFVAKRMYPIFYRAYHPVETMPERWSGGKLNSITFRLWKLFEERSSLNTSQARKLLNVTPKKGGSQLDRALQILQREYFITVSGNEQKVSLDGRLYGWPSNVYTRVEDWAPEDWLEALDTWSVHEARETIIDITVTMMQDVDRPTIVRVLKLG